MFAVEHEDIVPDILTVGKGFGGGFPMSGVMVRESLAFAKPWANPSGSSSSYGGNPLAAAAALASLRIVIEDGLVEHSRRLGELMLAEMRRWEREIPIVHDVRGRGLMIGMDLVRPGTTELLSGKETRAIFDGCLSRGVLAMIYNPEVRINPPLVITEAEAFEALGVHGGRPARCRRPTWRIKARRSRSGSTSTSSVPWACGWCAPLAPTRISADQVTVWALVIGLLAGHLFFYDSALLNAAGLLLFIVSDIFDSADGQLARLRSSSTRFGRILDGISDNARFVNLYAHLLARLLLAHTCAPIGAVALTLAAGVSHSLQSGVADFIRQLYLYVATGSGELDLPEDLPPTAVHPIGPARSGDLSKLHNPAGPLVRPVHRGRPRAPAGRPY